MEFILLLVLIIINGIFAMSEMAIVSARKARLQSLADAGDQRAQEAIQLAHNPENFLSTVQIGITLIGIVAGALGGSALSSDIAQIIATIPALAPHAQTISLIIIVSITTYLSLVIGELVPKRLALLYPEAIARIIAKPMHLLSRFATPLVWILSQSTRFIIRAMRIRTDQIQHISESEVLSLVRQGIASGAFAEDEVDMVQGVLQLDEIRIGSFIVPRTEITAIDSSDDSETIKSILKNHAYNSYPIIDGDLDHTIGIVRSKDIIRQLLNDEPIDLQAIILQPLYLPESVTASHALEKIKITGVHTALVLDEYGGIKGLIRTHNIVEQIVGDLDGGHFGIEDADIVERDDGSWLIDGRLTIGHLSQLLKQFTIPEKEEGDYETIAGFLMARYQRIPQIGDSLIWDGWRLEIVDMDGLRIDRILISPHQP